MSSHESYCNIICEMILQFHKLDLWENRRYIALSSLFLYVTFLTTPKRNDTKMLDCQIQTEGPILWSSKLPTWDCYVLQCSLLEKKRRIVTIGCAWKRHCTGCHWESSVFLLLWNESIPLSLCPYPPLKQINPIVCTLLKWIHLKVLEWRRLVKFMEEVRTRNRKIE